MFDGLGRVFDALATMFFVMLFGAVPLAIWKLVEIVIWLWDNVEIGVKK